MRPLHCDEHGLPTDSAGYCAACVGMHPTAATRDPIGLQPPRSPQPTEAGEGSQRGGSGCPMCLGEVIAGRCVERCEEGRIWRIDGDRLVRGEYRQIGNAVCRTVARVVAEAVRSA